MRTLQQGIALRRRMAAGVAAGFAWDRYIREWKRWKAACDATQKFLDARTTDKADAHMAAKWIIRQMQRLVGINPYEFRGTRKSGPKSDFPTSGKVGYRACTGNMWDNAMRAWDEDR